MKTAAQRFADAKAELEKLRDEGYEITGLHRLTLSKTAMVKEPLKAPAAAPAFKPTLSAAPSKE